MKKILLSLFTVMASLVAVAEEYEVTFSELGYENAEDVTSVNIGNVTLTLDKNGNSNGPKYYNAGSALRVYAQNSMTFESSETIVAIDFTIASSNPFNAGTTATEGTLSADFTSWAGSTNSVTITNGGTSKHVRITAIKVTTQEGGDVTYVPAPKFSLAEGTYYSAQTVEISWMGTDGTVFYAFGNDVPQPYTEPLEISELGTYQLIAYAQDAQGNQSEQVVANYTIAEAPSYNTLASVKTACTATSKNDAPTITFTADTYTLLVTYASGAYTFVSDGNEAFLFYGNQTALKTGDRFTGSITGQPYIYNGLREMSITEMDVNVVSGDNEVTPIEYMYDEHYNDYDANESKLFIIKNATFAADALTSRQVTFTDEESNELTAYDRFDVLNNAGFNTTDTYNVTGLLTQYNGTQQIYVTTIENLSGTPVDTIPVDTIPVDTIHIANTPETAYTVAEARAILDRRDTEGIYLALEDTVYVKGVVSKVSNFNANFGNLNLFIKDAQEDTVDIEAYRNLYLDQAQYTSADQVNVGDTVIVVGTLTVYKETYELAQGNYLYAHYPATDTTIVEPVDPYIATGNGTVDNPYTIEDVIGLYNINFVQLKDSSIVNVDTVWVRGYILGTVNTSTGATIMEIDSTTQATNLSVGYFSNDAHISVQLPNEKVAPGVRAALNLVDNPDNMGKEVLLRGIITKYCGVAGLKPCVDYWMETVEPIITVGDITDLIDRYLSQEADGEATITVGDITDLIDRYLNQTNE
ncbi:MAG: hypothetical protein IJV06_03300 [Bacteroidaceae bacterium]|nr:hypothetical protein [Bacteroidaceae bacterium]